MTCLLSACLFAYPAACLHVCLPAFYLSIYLSVSALSGDLVDESTHVAVTRTASEGRRQAWDRVRVGVGVRDGVGVGVRVGVGVGVRVRDGVRVVVRVGVRG